MDYSPPSIVIIGGGIAGLSAAYYAIRSKQFAKVTVLEAENRLGGKITTERVPFDGGEFIIEGGPDTFLAAKPWAVALCKELSLADRLHGTNPHQKNTYVLRNNKLQPLPDGLAMMIPTNIPSILKSHLVSWPGKVRMGLDFLLPSQNGHHDESLGQFVSRRLGREAYENLIEPLMSGIYAGDGDQLSLRSTFPYLHELEHKYGSLARGALQMRQQMAARGRVTQGSRSAFLTPTTGLAEIVEKLVESLTLNGADFRLNAPAKSVTLDNLACGTWHVTVDTGEALEADSVILATPAPVTGSMLASFDPELASVLQSIYYASTATVTLAYRQSDLTRPLGGYGYVIPRREGRRALACTWTSTKFPHRAPDGYALIRVFVGRAGQSLTPTPSPFGRGAFSPPLAGEGPGVREQLLDLAREELELTLGITAEPRVSRVFIWENAMPQYNLGHPEKLARIDAALEKYPGLALAGNGYRGTGIPDCIHSGELAVQKILESRGLENSPSPLTTR